ncbi:MAG: hypothetical protein ACYSTF_07070 [Planctomycetota bacterium]
MDADTYQNTEADEQAKGDFRPVNARDFPWVDLAFYERTAMEFQFEGFSLISDVEILPFSELFPRHFYRVMSNGDGTIVAEVCHTKARRTGTIWRLLLGRAPSFKTVTLTTEFSDGGLLYTPRGKRRRKSLALAPGVSKEIVPSRTLIRDMIEIHKDKMREYLHQNHREHAVSIRSFEDWVESQHRVKTRATAKF